MEIKDKIHTIRGKQVMLDSDLAKLYSVETKALNRAVRRNIERFPDKFMFQLNGEEAISLRYHYGTLENGRGKHRKYLPYVFTEQGVAMLSAVLRSKTSIEVSIRIIDAFVSMRKYLASNPQLFHIEKKLLEHDNKIDHIFNAIESKDIIPKKGIFFNGQTFDAYKFASDIIRSAKESIILLDNYIDDTTLTILSKRNKDVSAVIYTANITNTLKKDLEKHNSQYPKITIRTFTLSHDRFLIIDKNQIYHIGASLKDLGKKWFAFSRIDKEALKIITTLPQRA